MAALPLGLVLATLGHAHAQVATEPSALAQPLAEDLTPPVAAAWGSGLTFHSDDDLFSMQIRGRAQLQAFVESGVSPTDSASVDFIPRRLRLALRGHLLDAHLEYYVQFGFAPRDMEPDLLIPLRDAQIAWTAIRDLNIRVGVMKVPFTRQRMLSSSSLQFVDRSIVNAELSLDRDNGIQVYSTDLFGLGGILGYQLGVFGGDGRLRANDDLGLLWAARIQVQPLGHFEDAYSEADLTRSPTPRLAMAASFAYNDQTSRQRSTTGDFFRQATMDYFHVAADFIFKVAGFSLQGEFAFRQADGRSEVISTLPDGTSITEQARNGMGWMVQAGYLFDFAPIEIAARYADIVRTGEISALGPQRELTLGFSWYVMGHDLKLQLDGSYLANEVSGVVGTQERAQGRLQMQAYF